jgi:hypothetical protein
MEVVLPKRSRGRQSAAQEVRYQEELERFCEAVEEIDSNVITRASWTTVRT